MYSECQVIRLQGVAHRRLGDSEAVDALVQAFARALPQAVVTQADEVAWHASMAVLLRRLAEQDVGLCQEDDL